MIGPATSKLVPTEESPVITSKDPVAPVTVPLELILPEAVTGASNFIFVPSISVGCDVLATKLVESVLYIPVRLFEKTLPSENICPLIILPLELILLEAVTGLNKFIAAVPPESVSYTHLTLPTKRIV